MTRRLLLLALLLAPLSACATGPGYGRVPRTDRDQWVDAPLNARLYGDARRLDIRVSQPAHVAIFEIAPGRGIGMIYPYGQFDMNSLVDSRFSLNPTFRRHPSRFVEVGTPFYRQFAGPSRFYLLIASKRPLQTERFLNSPMALRLALGVEASSTSEQRMLDRLVTQVVPPQPDEDWTTDVLAVWPETPYAEGFNQGVVRVQCPDGTIVVTPYEMVRYACRRGRDNQPPSRPDTTTTDTTRGRIAHPGGTRPRPGEPAVAEANQAVAPRGRARQEPRRAGGAGVETATPPTEGSGVSEAPARRPRAERPERPERAQPAERAERAQPAERQRAEPAERQRWEPRQSSGGERTQPAPQPAPQPAQPAERPSAEPRPAPPR